jgi:type IV secretion system protein VirB6
MDNVDCHVRTLVQDSYRELVGPGTLFAAAFTGLLTIYVALIGYQMLLGRGGVLLSRLPLIGLKIGIIMALVTSWAAYQAVVFGLVFDGPRELLQALLVPLHNAYPGFSGDLYDGVERAYAALANAATAYGAQASPAANILQGGPMLGSGVLWLCAGGVLISTIGVVLASKILLGLLLAVGPVFVGFFLFEGTRGLFDGWVRTTLTVALAPLAANVFGVAMLIMLQPFVGVLQERLAASEFDMGAIMTISLIVLVFAAILLATLRLTAGLTWGFSSERRGAEPGARNERAEYSGRWTTIAQQGASAPVSPETQASPGAQAPWRIAPDANLAAPVATHERLGQRRKPSIRMAVQRGSNA